MSTTGGVVSYNYFICVCLRIVVSNAFCVFSFRLVCPIMHVSLHCSFFIATTVFSNVYFVAMTYSFTTIIRWNRHRSEKFDRKAQNKIYTPCPIYILLFHDYSCDTMHPFIFLFPQTMLNIFLLFLKFQCFQTDVRSFEITSIFNAKIV